MKLIYIPFFIICVLAGSCTTGNLGFQEAIDRNNRKLETEEQRRDAEFLVEATDYNILLRELAEKTSGKAYARVVSDFAAKNLQDHQTMAERIRDLAKDKKISLPSEAGDRHRNMVNDIEQATNKNVDRVYLNTIELVQERLIRLYENAALNANDAEIRSYAAAQLDIIRSHNRRSQEIRKQLI